MHGKGAYERLRSEKQHASSLYFFQRASPTGSETLKPPASKPILAYFFKSGAFIASPKQQSLYRISLHIEEAVLNLLEKAPDKVKPATLILPFATSAKDRTLPFTEEMEMTVAFIMAESDRKKSEGLILKKPAEELAFLTKSCYPIWLVPWSGKTLLFDALGVSARTILYEVLPEVKTFVNDIQGSATTRQAYSAALQDQLHYFESVKRVEEKTVLGLITSKDFLQDFQQYLIEAEEVEQSEIEVCLTPVIDEAALSSSISELSELRATLGEEMQSLHEAMRLINAATKQHVDTIRVEMKKMQADLNERIAEAKSLAMERIRQIQEKYDARILKTSQRFEKQLQDLNQERTKLEKAEGRVINKIERCDAEIQASKAQKDSGGERRWKDEKETWKREASTLKKSIEALDKQIEQTESQKKTEIANIRTEFNAQSEDAMKDVRELEATRESKTQLSQQEVKSMEDSTSAILSQLDTLTKKKRAALEELDRIGIREQRRKIALVHAPVYLACFRTEARRKYLVYPPSVAGSMKATTKLKGMLGMSKLGSLFQPRSKTLSNVLNQVTALADRDPVFEKDLYEAGTQASMLKSAESRERILKGLGALRNEEWVSVNEAQALDALLKT